MAMHDMGTAWMTACMLIVVAVVAVLLYFAYRYGHMRQRLEDLDAKG